MNLDDALKNIPAMSHQGLADLLADLSGNTDHLIPEIGDSPGKATAEERADAVREKVDAAIRAVLDRVREGESERRPTPVEQAVEVSALVASGMTLGAAVAKVDDWPLAIPASQVKAKLPTPILRLGGKQGAVLSEGCVCAVAGEGGGGKSALTTQIALSMGAKPVAGMSPICGGLFEAVGGDAIIATFEDEPGVAAWRLRQIAGHPEFGFEMREQGVDVAPAAFDRVRLLNMNRKRLFGPGERGNHLYNGVPERLAGWGPFEYAIRTHKPKLVVVDPALSAYNGNANDTSPVREFLDELAGLARDVKAGVLLVVHSNKAARKKVQNPDPFDPGLIGGAAGWHDDPRGALALVWDEDAAVLRCLKANYGPRGLEASPDVILAEEDGSQGAILGFYAKPLHTSDEVWHTPSGDQ